MSRIFRPLVICSMVAFVIIVVVVTLGQASSGDESLLLAATRVAQDLPSLALYAILSIICGALMASSIVYGPGS